MGLSRFPHVGVPDCNNQNTPCESHDIVLNSSQSVLRVMTIQELCRHPLDVLYVHVSKDTILDLIWIRKDTIHLLLALLRLAGGCISKGADESMSYHPDFIASQSPSYPASSKASRWVYLHLPM